MKKLIGRTIKKVSINPKTDVLTIVTNDKTFFYGVEGDCCSESYFYEIYGVDKIVGKEVKSVEELDLDVEDGTEGYGTTYPDSIQAYGIKISVEDSMQEIKDGVSVEVSNSMFIVFRNNSNGYYGGSIFEMDGASADGLEIKYKWSVK